MKTVEVPLRERIEIALGDSAYPPQLLDLPDPPSRLYVRGSTEVLTEPSLAVIGLSLIHI